MKDVGINSYDVTEAYFTGVLKSP